MEPKGATPQRVPRRRRDSLLRNPHLWLACSAGFLVFGFLTVLFGGDSLRPVREAMRIEWMIGERRGVYADCRESRNGLNRFCRKNFENALNRAVVAPSKFERPDKEVPFSLSGAD